MSRTLETPKGFVNLARFEHLPVIGVCGLSGAGKTTVIEALIPKLLSKGLQVAVVKHDCQHVQMDKPGKDSYRFYEAGADVYLLGGEETARLHGDRGKYLTSQLVELAGLYDIVLVEGHGKTPVNKMWMLSENELQPPDDVHDVLTVFGLNDRERSVLHYIEKWLGCIWQKKPVWGCVLIGGQSRRMGRPKHLLRRKNGESWLEHTVRLIEPFTDQVVISGSGIVPENLCEFVQLPDVPGCQGPLAGVLTACRWQPEVSWLLVACDMPDISKETIEWLLNQRRPGIWGIVPVDNESEQFQPLFAYYDQRCRPLFEKILVSGSLRIGSIVNEGKIATPIIPGPMIGAWRNVNTPDELL